ncbi:Nudix_Hydrolase domain containing protein [uncultured Caudovirales phage]|uniref:Nudix_Hydrolase domain containing protein n=1 Tax=uncultured Caudovirales phage TaxID=2100421 RepID=A0A6J5Q7F2_9CAUD|nr:Nudix_Hydrolase domain containing protein [uncultured Caudovirales phage]
MSVPRGTTLLAATVALLKGWDEKKHPRNPKGGPNGGEFTDSGKGFSYLDWLTKKPHYPSGSPGKPQYKPLPSEKPAPKHPGTKPDDPFGNTLGDWDMGTSSLWGGSDYKPMGAFAPVKARPGSKLHPAVDDFGKPIRIQFPTKAGPVENITNPDKVATFVPGGDVPASLNGVKFAPWKAPTTIPGWATVAGQNAKLEQGMPFNHGGSEWWQDTTSGKKFQPKVGAGVVIIEPDGRVWLTRPTNSFGNYIHTFPKGTVENGLSLQASAIKEAYEETGLKVKIVGVLGDYKRTTSTARFFVAQRVGGTPKNMGWESQALRLAPKNRLHALLNNAVDRGIADDFAAEFGLGKPSIKKERTDAELEALVARVGALLSKDAGAGLDHQMIIDIAQIVLPKGTFDKWKKGDTSPGFTTRMSNLIAAAKKGDYAALSKVNVGNATSKVKAALLSQLAHKLQGNPGGAKMSIWSYDPAFNPHPAPRPGTEPSTPQVPPLAGTGPGAMVYHGGKPFVQMGGGNPDQPRWPKGSPLGGQWKEYLGPIVKPPVIGGGASNPQYQAQANALFDMAQKGEWPLIAAATAKLQQKHDASQAKGKSNSHDKWNEKVFQYAQALQSDHTAAPVAEAKAVAIVGPDNIAGWTYLGAKPGGSAQGGLYKDAEGTTWLVKSYKSVEQAQNEVLSAKLMEAVGVNVPTMKLVATGDKYTGVGVGVASKMLDGEWKNYGGLQGFQQDNAADQIRKDFAVHAWLANYDAIGMSGDNYVVNKLGQAFHIDPGGALLYRAQGTPKGSAFTTTADEWDSLRSPGMNPQAAAVFGKMTSADLSNSAARLFTVTPDAISSLVNTYGPGNATAKAALTAKILARRLDVVKRGGWDQNGDPLPDTIKAFNSPLVSAQGKPIHPDPVAAQASAALAPKAPRSPKVNTGPEFELPVPKPTFASGFAHADKYYGALADKMIAAHKAGDIGALSALAYKNGDGTKPGWPAKTANGKAMTEFHSALLGDLGGKKVAGMAESAAQAAQTLSKPVPVADIPKPGTSKGNLPAMPSSEKYLHAPKDNASPQTKHDSGAHNAKIGYLDSLAKNGDVKGLLGQGYGSNHYAQKQVEFVNNALDALGSPFKVSTSQKANSHAAITGGVTPEQLASAGVKPPTVPQAPTPAAKPSAAPAITPLRIPAVPDFANWNGQGKPLSSKPHVNEQNQQLVNQMQAFGMKGDAAGLKAMKFQPLDKETGQPSGAMKPMMEHPSVQVTSYYKDALEAFVPKPPKPKMDAASIQKVGDAFKALAGAFPDSNKLLQFNHTIGRYGVLGKIEGDPLSGWKPTEVSKSNGKLNVGELHAKSWAGYNALSSTEKSAIKSYTGSAYHSMNNPVTGEGTHTNVGYAISGVAKAAVPLPVGMVISRGIGSMSAKDVKLLEKSEGHILKDFGIISTGLEPGWSGHVRLRITVGEGVKGLYVGQHGGKSGISVSGQESGGELLLPYGTKFYVRKVLKPGFKDAHGSWSSSTVVLDVVALPN